MSNEDAHKSVLLWALSARPTKTLAAIGTESAPTRVHVTPSGETYVVNVFPARVSFTQYGATGPVIGVDVETPPVARRRWKATPLPGVTKIEACVDPAPRVSRIMTPDLAQGSVFCWVATRATIVPSPFNGW